jgi:hypothetical protein
MSTLDDDIIGTGEAAKICHVTPQTMRNWHRSGWGPDAYFVKNRLKYRRSQCIEFYRNLSTSTTYRAERTGPSPYTASVRL